MKHPKTKQDLKKIKRKKINTAGMPKRDAKAVERAEKELDGKANGKPHGQQSLPAPGMSASVWPEVNEAAQKLALAQETAKSAAKARKAAHDVLVQKMKARGQPRYSDRSLGVVVELSVVDKAKLKKLDDGSRKRRGRGREVYP